MSGPTKVEMAARLEVSDRVVEELKRRLSDARANATKLADALDRARGEIMSLTQRVHELEDSVVGGNTVIDARVGRAGRGLPEAGASHRRERGVDRHRRRLRQAGLRTTGRTMIASDRKSMTIGPFVIARCTQPEGARRRDMGTTYLTSVDSESGARTVRRYGCCVLRVRGPHAIAIGKLDANIWGPMRRWAR